MTDPVRWEKYARLCLAILTLLAAPAVPAQVVLDAVPGGLVEIPLAPVERPRPVATFGQKRVLVMEFSSQWVALVGLPLSLVPGKYIVQARLEDDTDPTVQEFTVYPRRTVRPAVVTLSGPPNDRGDTELSWRDSLDAAFPLTPPVSNPARPLFGRYRRVSESESGHVDFVAFDIEDDTPVVAPGNGRIAEVSERAAGTFVWIDHGMDLYTCIGPVTSVTHAVNTPVKAGQSIGKVVLDKAGDTTSLYWTVFLNGAAIDPFLVSRLNRAPLDESG